jgi:hypothetical protein
VAARQQAQITAGVLEQGVVPLPQGAVKELAARALANASAAPPAPARTVEVIEID